MLFYYFFRNARSRFYFLINLKNVFVQWGDFSGLTQTWIPFESFINYKKGDLVGGLEWVELFSCSDVGSVPL